MKTYSKKSAFSLIELSIVLIIIGLLVAGITGGASLIKSATLRAVMTEARSYNTAVNSFYVAYNAYPGDYNVDFGNSGIAAGFKGDNDGKIEFNSGGTTAITKLAAEGFGAIAMLSYNKMVTNEITSSAYTTISITTTGTAGTTMPQSKIKGAGWIFDYFTGSGTTVGNSAGWSSDPQNVVILTTGFAGISATAGATLFKSGATTEAPKGAMNAEDAKSVDLKLDDGLPNTGKVKAYGLSTATTPVDCIATGAYNETAAKNNECILTYAVDVTS